MAIGTVAAIAVLVAWSMAVGPISALGDGTEALVGGSASDVARATSTVAFVIAPLTIGGVYLALSLLPGMRFLRERRSDHRLPGDVAAAAVAIVVAVILLGVSSDLRGGPWPVAYIHLAGGASVVVPAAAASAAIFVVSGTFMVFIVGMIVVEWAARTRAAKASAAVRA